MLSHFQGQYCIILYHFIWRHSLQLFYHLSSQARVWYLFFSRAAIFLFFCLHFHWKLLTFCHFLILKNKKSQSLREEEEGLRLQVWAWGWREKGQLWLWSKNYHKYRRWGDKSWRRTWDWLSMLLKIYLYPPGSTDSWICNGCF